jgi:hypothetical protein
MYIGRTTTKRLSDRLQHMEATLKRLSGAGRRDKGGGFKHDPNEVRFSLSECRGGRRVHVLLWRQARVPTAREQEDGSADMLARFATALALRLHVLGDMDEIGLRQLLQVFFSCRLDRGLRARMPCAFLEDVEAHLLHVHYTVCCSRVSSTIQSLVRE